MEGMERARSGAGVDHALGMGGRRCGVAKNCSDADADGVGENAPNGGCVPLRTVRYTDGSALAGRSSVILEDEDEDEEKRDEDVLQRRSVRPGTLSSGSWARDSGGELSGEGVEESSMCGCRK